LEQIFYQSGSEAFKYDSRVSDVHTCNSMHLNVNTMKNDTVYDLLQKQISRRESMIIAYSGGVDSALLAAVATNRLGRKRVHCIFIDSPLVPRSAVREAQSIASEIGISLEIINGNAMDEQFRKNPPDRCYYCKKSYAQLLQKIAHERGFSCVADGVNCSDLDEHRPGMKASTEEGIVHPFIKAGITKEDIRNITRECGYSFWNKPSAACLSSRIPYGEEITEEKLRMVESAEEYLHTRGFAQVRVRVHTGIARIEVAGSDIPNIISMREDIIKKYKEIGFLYSTLDLEGYRSGSMDEVL